MLSPDTSFSAVCTDLCTIYIPYLPMDLGYSTDKSVEPVQRYDNLEAKVLRVRLFYYVSKRSLEWAGSYMVILHH